MTKINNLAISGGGGSGPPVPTSGSAHELFELLYGVTKFAETVMLISAFGFASQIEQFPKF